MADLVKIAKSGKVVEFEKEWAKQNNRTYPLSTSDGQAAYADYNRLRSYDTGSSSGSSSTTEGFTSAIASTQGFTQMYTNPYSALISVSDIEKFASDLGSAFFGKQGNFVDGLKTTFDKLVKMSFDGMVDMLNKEVELRNKLNAQIGIAGELSRGYRDNIIGASDAAAGMAYSMDQLIQASVDITEKTGKFYTLSEDTLENMTVTSRAFIGDLNRLPDIFRNFELVGSGAENALQNINEAGKSALTLGLNTKTTTRELTENIGKLNSYGFERGIQGLADMTRKSTEFRMSMQEVFNIADKVLSPEGAIDLAANLQVLGGSIGSLGDPFQMMYMATNNVEGLQDALIGAAESLATYNSEQGRFEITGVNLRRAKEMAKELGVSYDQLASGAIAAAERTSAATDLLSAGVMVNEEDKEFITNLARMGPGGRMIIEVPRSLAEELNIDSTQALEDLNQSTVNAILSSREDFKEMDVKDIALEQFTETQKMALTVSEIAQMLKVQFAETYRDYGQDIDKVIKEGNDMIRGYMERTNPQNNEIYKEIDNLRKDAELLAQNKANEKLTSVNAQNPLNLSNTNTQNQKRNQTNNNITITHKHEHSINATEPILDNFKREVVKDPSTFESMDLDYRDFLNSRSQ